MNGIRVAIGIGGLAYGALGFVLGLPAIRSRHPNWTAAVFDLLLILVSVLLLYRVATGDTIAGLLAVTSWLAIGSGIAVVAVGVLRRMRVASPPGPSSGGSPT